MLQGGGFRTHRAGISNNIQYWRAVILLSETVWPHHHNLGYSRYFSDINLNLTSSQIGLLLYRPKAATILGFLGRMSVEEVRPKSSSVYTPGKDQEFVWSIVDKVVDGTKAVTGPVASVVTSGASASGHVELSPVDKSVRAKISKLSKDHVSDWLTANGLHIYRLGFQTNEVDGQSLLALLEFWKSDKAGFIKFAQESLGVKAPGHALRLASILEDVQTYKFEDQAVQKRDC